MIARIWHGRTKASDADIYREYVIKTGVPDYAATPGNMGIQIWQRQEAEITHIWTVSWWKDFESIKAFAGADFIKAKYYEEDKKFLLEFEEEVMHTEVFDFSKL